MKKIFDTYFKWSSLSINCIENNQYARRVNQPGKIMNKAKIVNIATTIAFFLLLINVSGCHQQGALQKTTPVQSKNSWYQSAQKTLQRHREQARINGPAKNIILFIADGHGITSNTALRIHEGQRAGKLGEEHILSFEHFPHLALSKTYNTDSQIPDSAGTATAMIAGIKTRIGLLSITDNVARGDCIKAKDHTVTTALEMAENAGMATGVITTARLTHATPAAAYAHSADRNFEDDTGFNDEQKAMGCRDIAQQFVEFNLGDGIDVAMGGGRQHFLPQSVTDSEGRKGKRNDNRHLVSEWKQRFPQGQYIENLAEFNQLTSNTPVLGLFNASHMQYEVDRSADKAGEPSLADMTEKTIQLLESKSQKTGKGYFLLIESGRVDHAHHAGNAYRALEDGRVYAEAIARANQMTREEDTLIIVTADHSHTLTMAGYASRGNPILGLSNTVDAEGNSSPELAYDGLPYTTLGYANGPGAINATRQQLNEENVTAKDFKQPALVPMEYETHGGEDVAIYARGPGAWLLDGTVEQHYIFHVMNSVAQW